MAKKSSASAKKRPAVKKMTKKAMKSSKGGIIFVGGVKQLDKW